MEEKTVTTYTRAELIAECRKWLRLADTQDMKDFVAALIKELEK